MAEELVTCDGCGETFDIESEGWDADGLFYCSYCESEYTYQCAKCQESELLEVQGDIGTLLFVDDSDEDEDLPPKGTYQIIHHPYYGGPILGSCNVYEDALRWIGVVPMNIDLGGYPAGHACRGCEPEIIGQVVAETCWPWIIEGENYA